MVFLMCALSIIPYMLLLPFLSHGNVFGVVRYLKECLSFLWTADWDGILTIDNLVKRNLSLVNWCCLCCCDGETVDHLLLHCKFAHALWSEVFLMFGLQWVMPRMVVSLLFAWENYLGLHSSVWNMVPTCLMWLIWRERNTRTYEDVEKSAEFLKSLLVGTLFGWSHIWGFTQVFSFLISCILFLFDLFVVHSVHHCEHDVLFLMKIFITY